MQENNYNILVESIKHLPTHEPPNEVWEQIVQELDIQSSIEQLPVYSPPSEIWDAIEQNLDAPARVKKIRPIRHYLAVAASIAVLLVAGIFYWNSLQNGDQFVYESTIIEGTFAYDNSWDEDDIALNQAVQLYKKDPLARHAEDYKRLLAEWEELNKAKAEVKAMMVKYGEDMQLVKQLGSIERDRSDVVKAMAVQI